nr:hypothetical protein [Chlamydiota bacterium]
FANEGLVEERFLTCKITSNNNTEHTIHRIKWARKAKAWRPWLLADWSQFKPVDLDDKYIKIIDQFISEPILPSLDIADLIELFQKAHELCYDGLEKACVERLKEHITLDDIIEVLGVALLFEHEDLIQNCFNFINKSINNLVLKWDPFWGTEVKIIDLNPFSRKFLDVVKGYIQKVTLHDKALTKIIEEKITFPEAIHCTFITGGSMSLELAELGKYLPKAKYLLSAGFSNLQYWPNVEILSLLSSDIPFDQVHKELSNLKCYIIRGDSCKMEMNNNVLVVSRGLARSGVISYNFEPFANFISEEIIFYIITSMGYVNKLDFTGCSKITDKLITRIAQTLADKNRDREFRLHELSLEGCNLITDMVVPFFKVFISLKTLNIKGCNISEKGIQEIKKSLPNCEVISGPAKRPADASLEDPRDSKKSKEEVD